MKLSPPGLLNPSLPPSSFSHPTAFSGVPSSPPAPLYAQGLLGGSPPTNTSPCKVLALGFASHCSYEPPPRCPIPAEHQRVTGARAEMGSMGWGGCCYFGACMDQGWPGLPLGCSIHPTMDQCEHPPALGDPSSSSPGPSRAHGGDWPSVVAGTPSCWPHGRRWQSRPALCWAKQKRLGCDVSAANSSFLFPALCCLPAIFACKQ